MEKKHNARIETHQSLIRVSTANSVLCRLAAHLSGHVSLEIQTGATQ